MKTLTLSIVHTSSTCVRYQLLDEAGKPRWSNRVVPTEAGFAGARSRMAAWALKHGVKVVDRGAAAQRHHVARAG